VAAAVGRLMRMGLTVLRVDPAIASGAIITHFPMSSAFLLPRAHPSGDPIPALSAKGAWQRTGGPGRIRREIEPMARFQSTSLEEIAWT
jgi:hypothetical protein